MEVTDEVRMPGNTISKAAKFALNMSETPASGVPYCSLILVRKSTTASVAFGRHFHTTQNQIYSFRNGAQQMRAVSIGGRIKMQNIATLLEK